MDRLIRGQYPIHRPRRTSTASSSVASAGDGRRLGQCEHTVLGSDSHGGRAGVGAAGAREASATEGRRHPQRLARRRHAVLHEGCQQRVPCKSQQHFSSVIVCAVCSSCRRASASSARTFASSGCVRPALRRARRNPEANPCAAPCATLGEGVGLWDPSNEAFRVASVVYCPSQPRDSSRQRTLLWASCLEEAG